MNESGVLMHGLRTSDLTATNVGGGQHIRPQQYALHLGGATAAMATARPVSYQPGPGGIRGMEHYSTSGRPPPTVPVPSRKRRLQE